MSALVTGGTGFVGTLLCKRLPDVHVLTRNPNKAKRKLGPHVKAFRWDGRSLPPPEAFEGVDRIFNLMGESIAEGRWTEKKKKEIYDSRILGTRALVQGIAAASAKPRVLVSTSAIGWYGDTGDKEVDEESPAGGDFLAKVCRDWEKEALAAEDLGVRVAIIRVGVVLGKGGALKKMLPPFKLGIGGRLGSGKQWMAWIHVEDLVNLYLMAGETRTPTILNGTAPQPVRNGSFTKVLGRVLHRPTLLPVPALGLRMAMGEMATMLLASQKVVPRATLKAGFPYKYPDLAPALQAAIQ